MTGLEEEPESAAPESLVLGSVDESPELGSAVGVGPEEVGPEEVGSVVASPELGSAALGSALGSVLSPSLPWKVGISSKTDLKSVLAWMASLVLVVSAGLEVLSPDEVSPDEVLPEEGSVGAVDELGEGAGAEESVVEGWVPSA